MNFIDDEVAMKQIDLLNIGTEYKILADTDKYTAFSYIDLSQTCIGVLKIFKDKNHYLLHLFTPLDFSLFNMYIEYAGPYISHHLIFGCIMCLFLPLLTVA